MILSSDRRQPLARRRHAFTLVEVLVVMAIVVVLASVATVAAFKYLENARVDAAYLKAKTLSKACQDYWVRHGDEGWKGENWTTVVAPMVEGADDGTKFKDPWGVDYHMDPHEDKDHLIFEVWTQHGPDRISSTKKPQ